MVQSEFRLLTEGFACPVDEIDGIEALQPSKRHPERSVLIYWKGYQTMLPDPDGELFKELTKNIKPLIK